MKKHFPSRKASQGLHHLAHTNDIQGIKRSLQINPDPDVEDDQGSTPLHYAAYVGHVDAIRALLKADAECDKRSRTGYTSLAFAASNGHPDVVGMLLRAKADCELSTRQHRFRPIHLATSEGQLRVVDVLLRARANASAQTTHGWTPVHLAAQAGHLEVCLRLLVENIAAIEMADHTGSTPLHAAVRAGHADCVRLLLSKQADPDSRNNASETALDLAHRLGKPEIVHAFEAGLMLQNGTSLGEVFDMELSEAPMPATAQKPTRVSLQAPSAPNGRKSNVTQSASAPDLQQIHKERDRDREREKREKSRSFGLVGHNLPFAGGGFLATSPLGTGFLSQVEIPGQFTVSRKHKRTTKVEKVFHKVFDRKESSREAFSHMQSTTKQQAEEIAKLMVLEVQFQSALGSAKKRAAQAEGNARIEQSPDLQQHWLHEQRGAMSQSRAAAAHLLQLKREVHEYIVGEQGKDVREHLGVEFLLNVHNGRRELSPLSKRVKSTAASASAPSSPTLSARSSREAATSSAVRLENPFRKARAQSPMRNLTIADALGGKSHQSNRSKFFAAENVPEERQASQGLQNPLPSELESTKKRQSHPPFPASSTLEPLGRQGSPGITSVPKASYSISNVRGRSQLSTSNSDHAVVAASCDQRRLLSQDETCESSYPRSRSHSREKERSKSSSPHQPQLPQAKSTRPRSDAGQPRVDASSWTFIASDSARQVHRAPALSGRRKLHSEDRQHNVPNANNIVQGTALNISPGRYVAGKLVVAVDTNPKVPQEGSRTKAPSFSDEEIYYFVGVSEADEPQ